MKRFITIDIETLPIDESPEANLFWEDEEGFLKTALDGTLGRILCIGYLEQNDMGKIIAHGCFGWNEAERKFEMDEPKTLAEFWDFMKSFDINRDLIIGHNIMEFDLPFIIQRSLIKAVQPTVRFSFAKYRNQPIFDTMCEWDCWKWGKKTSLEKLAFAFGLENPKTKINQKSVFEMFQDGEYQKLHDYCMSDVKATHLIWRKLAGRRTSEKSMALAN
jgi:DNA polymerase elongation subunit (family B)